MAQNITVGALTELPTLFAKGGRKDEILQWRAFSKNATVYMEYGKQGGKLQLSHYEAAGVNDGKSNARNAFEQAIFEADSAWRKKIKEGYFVDLEEAKASQVIRPMKAHRFDKQGHKLKYPCDMQRKYNGIRCLAICRAAGEVQLMSNGGETWNVPHINAACAAVMKPGDMLDGELYIHGVSLQAIASLVKRNRPESLALNYVLYDMPQKNGVVDIWDVRRINLSEILAEDARINIERIVSTPGGGTWRTCLEEAETRRAPNEEHITQFERQVIFEGYEGVMLRNRDLEYKFNGRSYNILKWKRFQDAEFTVIDMRSRTYVNPATQTPTLICDICVCRNNSNERTFEVVPRGAVEVKAEYWKNRAQYIGTPLVVRFLERSDDGIPQGNPVGICFRIDEDINPLEDDEEF